MAATNSSTAISKQFAHSYYDILGVHPSASPLEIRRAYRELSKQYHPDTTQLPQDLAKKKFQNLNEAYATLSNPQRRVLYDHQIGYSSLHVIQPSLHFQTQEKRANKVANRTASYVDRSDRPLSSGEIFVLLLLGATFLVCIGLVIIIGLTRGEGAFRVPEITKTSSTVIKSYLDLFKIL
ncbi:J domain-containing protein [Euhalothece natronophila Z-M001]|uniref:J domain-containing protein n=1 Tax=Euhalothece natronophila Z-M001 TaxID=522448 RepID=A0A5B8NRV4_9CHRO|nr:J domain-containing protein [Euhalothece natronophila]QDZ40820.1 J domain-containing protein [Euhalothece natronophila Z-M001]